MINWRNSVHWIGVFIFLLSGLLFADRYSDWKEALAPEDDSKAIIDVHNDYIAVQLDDEDGQFNIGTWPAEVTLLYAFPSDPWSSWTIVRIDGVSHTNDDSHGGFPAPPLMAVTDPFGIVSHSGDSSYIEGGWTVGAIDITQVLMPVYLYNSTDTTGTIFIHYTITNNDTENHTVGVLLQMDTMVDTHDDAPLSTVYGYAAVEQDFYGPSAIPAYWTACTDPPPPLPSTICAQGYLTGYDAVAPDRFAVGSWGAFNDVVWDYSISSTAYWDSAVLIWWYEVMLAPGESWEVATYYGLGLPEEITPEVTIIEPDSFMYSACSNQQIIIEIWDDSGIQEETIELNVNGLVYTTYSSEIEWVSPYLYFTPSVPFENGDTVTVILVHAEDFFGNSIDPVTWDFYMDLEGPYIHDFNPPEGNLVYDTLTAVSLRITDDLTGLNEGSVLASISGILTPSYAGTFTLMEPGISWDGELLTYYPESAAVSWTLDDTITVSVVRATDSPDLCDPNPLQEPSSFWFVMADDDTLPPIFNNYFVDAWPDENPFYIECDINDPSGIFDDITDISGQGIYLLWDIDGSVSLSDYSDIVQMESIGGNRYRTISQIGVQPADSNFVYMVRAYDNDFEYDNPADRTEGFSYPQSVVKVSLTIPYQDAYTSCGDQTISVFVENLNGIVADSLTLTAQGRRYTVTGSADLAYNHPYLELTPSVAFDEGLVMVELSNIYDSLFTAAPSSQTWSFIVDLTPPVISMQDPEPEAIMETDDFDISFHLGDSISGLNIGSIEVHVGGQIFGVGSTGANWSAGVFEIDVEQAGLNFPDGIAVEVQVIAEDVVDIAFCPRNVLDTSWEFYMGSAACERIPNPITPNADNKNDYVTFTFPNMVFKSDVSEILIFNTESNIVRELAVADLVGEKWIWDGNDNNGTIVKQGVYIYIIKTDDTIICNGTITVIH